MTDTCWLWTGSVNTWGYGQIRDERGRYTSAHRMSYRLLVAPLRDDKHVLHRCDNPRCVRPSHLFLGTAAQNMADKCAKGRQARGSSHGSSKLRETDVIAIRRAIVAGEPLNSIATRYGVTRHAIADIARRKSWAHLSEVA